MLSIIFAVTAASVLSVSASSGGICGTNVGWTLDDSGVLTISGSGAMYNYTDTSSGYAPWFEIRSAIKSVVIKDGVTSIGNYAFFACKFSSITIPSSVRNIGTDAFRYCDTVTAVHIDDVHAWYTTVFSNGYGTPFCTASARLYLDGSLITDVVIPEGTTSIGNHAFRGFTAMTNITIPDSVTSIGTCAFYNCISLTGLDLPSGITSIGSGAFTNCKSITNISLPDKLSVIDDTVFYLCSSLKSIVIPEGVTKINSYAFRECSALESITIPTTLRHFGSYAFDRCKALKNIYISDLEKWCSITCDSSGSPMVNTDMTLYLDNKLLTNLVIPDSITCINNDSFLKCSNIQSITIHDNVTTIENSAFYGCKNVKNITIGNGVKSIGAGAFDTTALETLYWNAVNATNTDSSSTNGIFNGAGANGSKFDVIFGNGVTHIPPRIFYTYYTSGKEYNYVNAASVTIPKSVQSIGEDAFYWCEELEKVNIEDLDAWCRISFATNYSNPLFVNSNLYLKDRLVTELEIPDSITSINPYAFRGCASLKSITLHEDITSIGKQAFYDCAYLEEIYWNAKNVTDFSSSQDVFIEAGSSGNGIEITFGKDVEHIPNYLFYNSSSYRASPKIIGVYISNKVKSIGNYAFYKCTGLTNLEIGSGVKTIGSYAFYGCSGISSVTIPGGVELIPNSTFSGCSNLTTLTIPASVGEIGYNAFYGCDSLVNIYYTGTEEQWNSIKIYSGNTCLTGVEILALKITGITITDLSKYGVDMFTAEVVTNSPLGSEAIFVAAYDGNDNLLDAKLVTAENMKTSFAKTNVSYVKAFVWKTLQCLTPACDSQIVYL